LAGCWLNVRRGVLRGLFHEQTTYYGQAIECVVAARFVIEKPDDPSQEKPI